MQINQLSRNLAPFRTRSNGQRRAQWHHWHVLVTTGVALLLWQFIVQLFDYPAFILPSPLDVLRHFGLVLENGSLLHHTGVTLGEVLAGLLLGMMVAVLLGYPIARSRLLERLLSPYIVASQAVPVVAIAPLLVIWFGAGTFSKVLICALIVFFPILINVIVGVRSVPDDLYTLMRSLKATRWQVFWHLELPAALPVLFGGLKIGATLAVIGAVVGEFMGGDDGLGYLIIAGRGQFNTPLVFVAVITLVAIALGIYGLVSLAERRLLAWQNRGVHGGSVSPASIQNPILK